MIHSSTTLITRYIIGLETNFYWAAATLNIAPLQLFFAPYYTLGIVSLFAHLAAVIYFGRGQKTSLPSWGIIGVGSAIALIIVATFVGAFYDIQIPTEYMEYFEGYIR